MSITICDDDFHCPICLEDYKLDEDIIKMNCCGKFLHKSCLCEWRKQKRMNQSSNCVLCRNSLNDRTFEKLPVYCVEEESIYNETNINITININTNNENVENKCFIDDFIDCLKLDSCFRPNTNIRNDNINNNFMSRN